MWNLSFTPYQGKETIGTLVGVCKDNNGVVIFTHEGSVNLDDKGSVDDFLARAKKSLAASTVTIAQTKIDDKLLAITADLNK